MSEYKVSDSQSNHMKHALGVDWITKEDFSRFKSGEKYKATRNHACVYEHENWISDTTTNEFYNLLEQGLMNCFRRECKPFKCGDSQVFAYLYFFVTREGISYLAKNLGFEIANHHTSDYGVLVTRSNMTDEMKQCSRFVAESQ